MASCGAWSLTPKEPNLSCPVFSRRPIHLTMGDTTPAYATAHAVSRVLQAAGWETHRIATANQLGAHHGYERGFDTVRTAVDFRGALEHHLDRVVRHDIDLWRRGERSEAESIVHFRKDFGLLLAQIHQMWQSSDKSLWPPPLMRINRRVVRGLEQERRMVEHDPLTVTNKISRLSGGAYWRFLGEAKIRPFKRFFLARSWLRQRTDPALD